MPAIKYVNIDTAVVNKLLEKIKSTVDMQIYHAILCDLILYNHSDLSSQYPIVSAAIAQISQMQEASGAIDLDVKEILVYELHRSWERSDKSVTSFPFMPSELLSILAWGYELKCSGTKSVNINDWDLAQIDAESLMALWLAIKISGVEAIAGINNFGKQSPESWRISCQGLADSQLTSLAFARGDEGALDFSHISVEMWRSFWRAITLSRITHLDLCSMEITAAPTFPVLWDIMCEGLAASKVQSLSLESMGLYELNRGQRLQLYHILDRLKVQFLDLTGNFLHAWFFLAEVEGEQPQWDVICDIVSLRSLRHLRIRDDLFELISSSGWDSLCHALANSHLEKLDISVSTDGALAPEAWLTFIAALKQLRLTSLSLSYYSTAELSADTFKIFCEMIEASALDSVVLVNQFGELSLSAANWQMLGNALQKRGIKSFDFGTIKLSDLNVLRMSKALVHSGIEELHMRGCDLSKLSHAAWTKLSAFIKEAHIKVLGLPAGLPITDSPDKWHELCKLITKSGIKSLYFDVLHYDDLSRDMVEQFCSAIRNSQLQTLVLDFQHCNQMQPQFLQMIFNAINKSKIIDLPCQLSQLVWKERQAMMANTLRIVSNRAKYKNTLFGLCASTLFQKYNAELTENGVAYGEEDENKLIHKRAVDLCESDKKLLQLFS